MNLKADAMKASFAAIAAAPQAFADLASVSDAAAAALVAVTCKGGTPFSVDAGAYIAVQATSRRIKLLVTINLLCVVLKLYVKRRYVFECLAPADCARLAKLPLPTQWPPLACDDWTRLAAGAVIGFVVVVVV
jgi:hypothetical protein